MSDYDPTKVRADRSTSQVTTQSTTQSTSQPTSESAGTPGNIPGNQLINQPGGDPVKILTEILNQVRSGFERPPLSAEARRAIAIYARIRLTLGDKPPKATTPTPIK